VPATRTPGAALTLGSRLAPEGIRTGLEVADLTEALRLLLERLPEGEEPTPGRRAKLARDLAFGSAGDVVRLTADVVAVIAPREWAPGTAALIGVAREPFLVTGEGRDEPSTARVVVLLLTSRRLASLRDGALPTLERWLRESGQGAALARAGTVEEVLALPGLMELVLEDFMRVESALTPVTYRVYPDTPLGEVVDLMARRHLHAVPVVGQGYEVMGIITAGDALRDLLPRRRSSEPDAEGHESEGLTARDVMTRTVMCVSEDQPLIDAAALMVNRDVEQLPVVREGELVGFLTRDAVLRALFGR
jgi:CBS domain-containing protein